jgi:hypothetical protein
MKIRQSLKYILDCSIPPRENINQDDTKSHKELTMSTFWGYFSIHNVAKKMLASAKGKRRAAKKIYLKNLFEFSLNYGFCGLPSKHYSIFDFISLSLLLFLTHFGDIFSSFSKKNLAIGKLL